MNVPIFYIVITDLVLMILSIIYNNLLLIFHYSKNLKIEISIYYTADYKSFNNGLNNTYFCPPYMRSFLPLLQQIYLYICQIDLIYRLIIRYFFFNLFNYFCAPSRRAFLLV